MGGRGDHKGIEELGCVQECSAKTHVSRGTVMANGRKTRDAVKILHRRYIKGSKKRLASLARERENLRIAEQIYELRTAAGLNQKDLARRIGTTQSVISRLEDADYDGHSLTMLERIAHALGHRLCIHFVPQDKPCAVAK
jgi:ribosome-binding protein aMBF1 (putative translation factor)